VNKCCSFKPNNTFYFQTNHKCQINDLNKKEVVNSNTNKEQKHSFILLIYLC